MAKTKKNKKAVGGGFSLEETIKMCGINFHALYYQPLEKYPYLAVARPQKDTEEYTGYTPLEAVSKLLYSLPK